MKKKILYVVILLAIFSFSYIKYYNMNINDIGLKVLSAVKVLKGESVDLNDFEKENSAIMAHNNWTDLLQRHVNQKGNVNYGGFVKDSVLLNVYLEELSDHPPGKNWTESDKLAYWINAYNAFTVKLIVNHYPLESIKDISNGLPMISSPWDIKFFKIGGIDFDLNTIEHQILRKEYEEPRIHFAINCASFSCPDLRNEAFTASGLEQQLEEQAISFVNDPSKNLINETETKLSSIFDWFKSDFSKKGDLLSYIKIYKPTIKKDNKVEYLDYDWSLNN